MATERAMRSRRVKRRSVTDEKVKEEGVRLNRLAPQLVAKKLQDKPPAVCSGPWHLISNVIWNNNNKSVNNQLGAEVLTRR